MVRTADLLPELRAIAARVTTEPLDFVLTDDCASWGQAHGTVVSGDPNAMAVRRTRDGRPIIVLLHTYEPHRIHKTVSSLWAAGWHDQAEEVRDGPCCLRFLVLHELAHLVNNWGQDREQDCNEWAFRHLGWTDDAS